MKKHEEQPEEVKEEITEQPVDEPNVVNEVEGQEELSEIEKAELAATEAKDKYLRLYSEFENFRRRTARERIEFMSTAGRDLIESLLPVVDDFDRAKLSADAENATVDSVKEGMDLIQQKLYKTLEGKGVRKMAVKKGDAFDDEFHEAITQIPSDKKLEGKIVDVVEPGYFLNDTVIRFAKVITGAKR